MGLLWEHLLLNEIHAWFQLRQVHYWRDKVGHEVDFALIFRGLSLVVIECKWSTDSFEPRNVLAFSRRYPEATFYVVAADVKRAYSKRYKNLSIRFISLPGLISELKKKTKALGRQTEQK
ncbi:MAG: hypothetical protein DRG83_09350 [Deltaproteobacteria bacterium]|nr:MAG: hypothetical protein DRG83_09350 [Deltaproteobacteria bacterium]